MNVTPKLSIKYMTSIKTLSDIKGFEKLLPVHPTSAVLEDVSGNTAIKAKKRNRTGNKGFKMSESKRMFHR